MSRPATTITNNLSTNTGVPPATRNLSRQSRAPTGRRSDPIAQSMDTTSGSQYVYPGSGFRVQGGDSSLHWPQNRSDQQSLGTGPRRPTAATSLSANASTSRGGIPTGPKLGRNSQQSVEPWQTQHSHFNESLLSGWTGGPGPAPPPPPSEKISQPLRAPQGPSRQKGRRLAQEPPQSHPYAEESNSLPSIPENQISSAAPQAHQHAKSPYVWTMSRPANGSGKASCQKYTRQGIDVGIEGFVEFNEYLNGRSITELSLRDPSVKTHIDLSKKLVAQQLVPLSNAQRELQRRENDGETLGCINASEDRPLIQTNSGAMSIRGLKQLSEIHLEGSQRDDKWSKIVRDLLRDESIALNRLWEARQGSQSARESVVDTHTPNLSPGDRRRGAPKVSNTTGRRSDQKGNANSAKKDHPVSQKIDKHEEPKVNDEQSSAVSAEIIGKEINYRSFVNSLLLTPKASNLSVKFADVGHHLRWRISENNREIGALSGFLVRGSDQRVDTLEDILNNYREIPVSDPSDLLAKDRQKIVDLLAAGGVDDERVAKWARERLRDEIKELRQQGQAKRQFDFEPETSSSESSEVEDGNEHSTGLHRGQHKGPRGGGKKHSSGSGDDPWSDTSSSGGEDPSSGNDTPVNDTDEEDSALEDIGYHRQRSDGNQN